MMYLFEKYNIVVESRYPEYMMDRYRNSILDILEELGKHITNGYTIYPESDVKDDIKYIDDYFYKLYKIKPWK